MCGIKAEYYPGGVNKCSESEVDGARVGGLWVDIDFVGDRIFFGHIQGAGERRDNL